MDSLALRHLNRKTITYNEVCGKGASQIGFDEVDIERATAYAAEDAEVTFQLHQAMWPDIEKSAGLRYIYEQIELPTAVVLQKMERNGVLIDVGLLNTQSHELGYRMLEMRCTDASLLWFSPSPAGCPLRPPQRRCPPARTTSS